MAQYFGNFPLIGYDIFGTGEKRLVIDIMQRAAIRNTLQNQSLIYYLYQVKDGETPEMIAFKLYGDPTTHWIILFANDIFDRNYDWPMSNNDLTATILKRYGTPQMDGLTYAYSTVHHYEDTNGNVIDEFTYKTLPDNQRVKVTVYDWEVSQNESKRSVKLLEASYVPQIQKELKAIMQRATV